MPSFIDRLVQALEGNLRRVGIEAKVIVEPVRRTRLYRVFVISDRFEELRHSERQEVVWRIARETLTPDQVLRISMILTLTIDEMGDDESHKLAGRRR